MENIIITPFQGYYRTEDNVDLVTEQNSRLKKLLKKLQTKEVSLDHLHEKEAKALNSTEDTDLDEISELFENTFKNPASRMNISEQQFKKTDLIVFKDDYEGLLPLNGIRETEFKKTIQLYNAICLGKTCVNIEGDKQFCKTIKKNILKLLTRRLGWDLINALANEDMWSITIIQSTSNSTVGRDKRYTLYLSTDLRHHVTMSSKGGKQLKVSPLYIVIAHEAIHILLRHPETSTLAATLGKDLTNSHEQEAIFGLKSQIIFTADTNLNLFDLDEDALQEHFQSVIGSDYCEFSENNFRAVFGLSYRLDHQGIKKPENLNVSSDQVPKEIADYFLFIFKNGCEEEIAEFLKINEGENLSVKTFSSSEGLERSLLEEALEDAFVADNMISFYKLVALGANPALFCSKEEDKKGWSLPQALVAWGSERMLAHVLSNEMKDQINFDINSVNTYGNTLLHIALKKTRLFEKTRRQSTPPVPVMANLMELLLNNGIDQTIRKTWGKLRFTWQL